VPNLPWTHRTLFQMTLIATCDLAQIVNTHHFEASQVEETSFSTDQLAIDSGGALADDWVTNMKTSWLATHTSDYVLQVVKVQVVERPANFRHKLTPIERPLSTANVGTVGLPSDAGQVAAVVKWRTPQAGKSHRGRTYVGPLSSAAMSNGLLSGTVITNLNAWHAAMLARYSPTGTMGTRWNLTVYSRPYNSGEYQYATRKTGTLTVVTPPDYAGNSTNITAAALDTVLRTQRRREFGVGA
jgi:hypothetical protein